MKHIHIYYDEKYDELVLAGTDNHPINYYPIDDPATAIRALMAETQVAQEWEEELDACKKEDRKARRLNE
jgi:hypothetical protein